MKHMDPKSAKAFLRSRPAGACNLVDVREPWEYEESHLPGATLIPLATLVECLDTISRKKPTLVYCRSGKRSAAAASLLTGQGFDEVYNLTGGMLAWKGETAVGPREAGLYHFTGKETPLEILKVAHAMEAHLGAFYASLAESSKDAALKKTFSQLAAFEAAHRRILVKIAEELGHPGDILKVLDTSRQDASAGEGGWAPAELLKKRRAFLGTPQEVLEAAMMFETQALDLYLRSQKGIENPRGRTLLGRLADQEKGHLDTLARLMDKKRLPDMP